MTFSNIHPVLSFITDISLFRIFPLFFCGWFDIIKCQEWINLKNQVKKTISVRSSCSQFHYRHQPLLYLPPLLLWTEWHHKCQQWNQSQEASGKNHFPPDHLLCCFCCPLYLFGVFPLFFFRRFWCHWMLYLNNLKHQIKATFPTVHLLICSLVNICFL